MSGFDDRKKAFEAQYQHDQDLMFRVQSRRNRLLGLWAAEQMGLPEGEAAAYAQSVVVVDFDKPGDMDVHDKVYADLQAHGVDLSDHRLRRKMDDLLEVARQQVMTESKAGG